MNKLERQKIIRQLIQNNKIENTRRALHILEKGIMTT